MKFPHCGLVWWMVHISYIHLSIFRSADSEDTSHCILFYCGPSDNKHEMMEIGKKLVDLMDYTHESGAMFYKTNTQFNAILGTRATGNKKHSKYRITVPRNWSLKRHWHDCNFLNLMMILSMIFPLKILVPLHLQ